MSKAIDTVWFTQNILGHYPTIGIVMVEFEDFERKEPRCYIGNGFGHDAEADVKKIMAGGAKLRISDLEYILEQLKARRKETIAYEE